MLLFLMLGKLQMKMMVLYHCIHHYLLVMVLPNAMMNCAEGQGDPHIRSFLGSKDSGLPGGLQIQEVRHYYGEQIYGGVWEKEREREWFLSCGQRQI